MEILVELKGQTALVMHNIRLADPDDEITRAITEISGKRKKTDADRLEIARLEFLGGLYYDAAIGVYVPSWNILKCLERAGSITKQGTAVIRSVSVTTDKVPLKYEGPETPEELWRQKERHFRRQVVVKRNTVTRMRPMFLPWQLRFSCELAEDILNPQDFAEICHQAGRMEGLCDARKLGYGRFEAETYYEAPD